ncbi:hypothetical protein FOMPIDRAFT_88902 [Fomitopsis schrenkii]|uniref:CFEM domain-containing protein n=1 Tax=Fomitopsis schrenkii TaxID=2126942 RepID=S8F3N2_FOMSC|nr:hypothetical protein FOMPIDRAFT_88902 [Fomitopsis schrenkii]
MIHTTLTLFVLCAWFSLCNAFGFPGGENGHHVDCGIRELLVNTVPMCAATCWETANYGNCSIEIPDARCLCSDRTFADSLYGCIGTSCPMEDALEYLVIAREACESVGVNITLPSFLVQD